MHQWRFNKYYHVNKGITVMVLTIKNYSLWNL